MMNFMKDLIMLFKKTQTKNFISLNLKKMINKFVVLMILFLIFDKCHQITTNNKKNDKLILIFILVKINNVYNSNKNSFIEENNNSS